MSPNAPHYRGKDVVLAADCVAYALGNFHNEYLKGKSLAIACPKLDDTAPYVEKLANIFRANETPRVTVAIMEVPCCRGLDMIVREAIHQSGTNVPMETVVIGIDGNRRS